MPFVGGKKLKEQEHQLEVERHEKELAQLQLNESKANIMALQKRIVSMQDEIEQLTKNNEQLSKEKEELQEKMEAVQAELTDLTKKHDDLKQKHGELISMRDDLKERLARSEEKESEATKTKDELDAKFKETSADLVSKEAQVAELQKKVLQIGSQLSGLQRERDAQEEQRAELLLRCTSRMNELKVQHGALEGKLAELKRQKEMLNKQETDMAAELSELIARSGSLAEQAKIAAATLAELEIVKDRLAHLVSLNLPEDEIDIELTEATDEELKKAYREGISFAEQLQKMEQKVASAQEEVNNCQSELADNVRQQQQIKAAEQELGVKMTSSNVETEGLQRQLAVLSAQISELQLQKQGYNDTGKGLGLADPTLNTSGASSSGDHHTPDEKDVGSLLAENSALQIKIQALTAENSGLLKAMQRQAEQLMQVSTTNAASGGSSGEKKKGVGFTRSLMDTIKSDKKGEPKHAKTASMGEAGGSPTEGAHAEGTQAKPKSGEWKTAFARSIEKWTLGELTEGTKYGNTTTTASQPHASPPTGTGPANIPSPPVQPSAATSSTSIAPATTPPNPPITDGILPPAKASPSAPLSAPSTGEDKGKSKSSLFKGEVKDWFKKHAPTSLSSTTVVVSGKTVKCYRVLVEGEGFTICKAKDEGDARYVLRRETVQAESQRLNALHREAALLKKLKHPSIVALVAHDVIDKVINPSEKSGLTPTASAGPLKESLMLMEFVGEKSLLEVIMARVKDNGKAMAELEALRVFKCIVDAVVYLHIQDPPVAHRDIRAENIIVCGSEKDSALSTPQQRIGACKLAQLSSCSTTAYLCQTPAQVKLAQEEIARHTVWECRSPEEAEVKPTVRVDQKVDIWCLGALLYFMCTGNACFPSAAIARTGKYEVSRTMSMHVANLIRDCLSMIPTSRPDAWGVAERVSQLLGERFVAPPSIASGPPPAQPVHEFPLED